MATLVGKWTRTGDLERLKLTSTSVELRRRALGLPGAIESDHSITFPPEPHTMSQLRGDIPLLQLEPALEMWLNFRLHRAKRLIALGRESDATLSDIPWAGRLYPYQRVGAFWLALAGRAILGDEVGLGKTIQALTAARLLGAKRVLIVTLNSVKQSVWAAHCRDWLQQDVTVAEGSRSLRERAVAEDAPWLIVNHEMLRPAARYDQLFTTPWDVVIVDEAHKLQGRGTRSQQSRGAELLRTKALFLLTGTPIWSDPESLWHLLRLLQPYRFSSYWRWVDEYFNTRETPWTREIIGVKPERYDDLKAIVAPLLLKRTKAEMLPQLPSKIVQTLTWEPTATQRKYYNLLKKKRQLPLPGDTRYYDSPGAALADMRRLLNSPALLGTPSPTPKDDLIDDLVDSVPGKIVIFTWHRDYAEYLRQRLQKKTGSAVAMVLGGYSPVKRDAELERFRDSEECRILIGTIGAIGTALNDLVVASVAIFAEGAHVPTYNEQAEGRLHRNGQKTDVTIYRLVAPGTVEEAVWEQNDKRIGLSNDLLAMDELVRRVFEN